MSNEIALSRVLVRVKALIDVEMLRAAEDRLNLVGMQMHFYHICAEEGVGFATRNAVQDQSDKPVKSNLEVVQGQDPAGSQKG